MRVAVVGAGAAGMAAAGHLQQHADVTLFEADNRLGGHVDTHSIRIGNKTCSIDTGFSLFNRGGYPRFSGWLEETGIAAQPADVSFSVSIPATGLEYGSGGLGGLFCQKRNLLSPAFWLRLRTLYALHRTVSRYGNTGMTLAELLQSRGIDQALLEEFLAPVTAAFWSLSLQNALQAPSSELQSVVAGLPVRSFDTQTQWFTIAGGSRSYVEAFARNFSGSLRLGERIRGVTRSGNRVFLQLRNGSEEFDALVLACHSDQALALLQDPSPAEREILGSIRYRRCRVVLHSDSRVMPEHRKAWGSFNLKLDGDGGQITYWMNRLQRLPGEQQYFVTRDPIMALRQIWSEAEYLLPEIDTAARQAQARRGEIDGVGGICFAGAYWGLGTHEDAFVSGLEAARLIGRRSAMAA